MLTSQFRGISTVITVLLALLVAGLPASPRAKAAGSGTTSPEVVVSSNPGPDSDFRGGSARSEEVKGQRTQTSRTFTNSYGSYETEVFPVSIHYRNNGQWDTIRNTLVDSPAQGYAHENAANKYQLLLPPTIGGAPVRINVDNHFVGFALTGAQGRASVSGPTATYAEALPGVDVEYTAMNDSVKEDLILKSASSTSTFTWRLNTSAGVNAKEDGAGGIYFSDTEGKALFHIPPPLIFDSSTAGDEVAPQHRFELVQDQGRREIRLAVDPEWLSAPGRVFPVTVDPQAVFSERDCWITSASPNAGACSGSRLQVAWDGTNRKRSLLKFDFGANIPSNATVLHSEVGMYAAEKTNSNKIDISLRPITEGWSEAATWNNRLAGTAWSPSGGTFDESEGYISTDVGASLGWYYWHPTDLVQKWVNGTIENRGFLLKPRFETDSWGLRNEIRFVSKDTTDSGSWPVLNITWDNGGMGEFKTYKLEERQLTDRAHLHANVAGGNMMLHHTDLTIPGKAGLDLRIDRYFNGLLHTNHLDTTSNVGEGWTLSTGADIGLKLFRNGSAAFFGESGYRLPFTKDPLEGTYSKDAYETPIGLEADLDRNNTGDAASTADDTFVLKWRKNKEKFLFNASGHFIRHEDKDGNKIEFVYSGNKVDFIVDTLGRKTDLDYDPTSGQLVKITDPMQREHLYGYDAGKLKTYTNPEGETYHYGYNGSEDLDVFKDPLAATRRGHETHFAYRTDGYVTQIKHVTDETTTPPTGDTTTLEYTSSTGTICQDEADAPGFTTVTDPRGNKTRYCYTKLSRVKEIWDARDSQTSLQYNSEANVTSFKDAEGREFGFQYDQTSGDMIGTTAPGSNSTSTGETANVQYGNDGHDHDGDNDMSDEHKHLPVETKDTRGYVTELKYDAEDHLTTVHQTPATADVRFEYSYNPDGSLKQIHAPAPEPDALDASGKETQGNDTILDYYPEDTILDGDDGMLRTIDHPDAGALGDFSFEYDMVGHIVAMNDGRGSRTEFTYDAVDRLRTITYSDGTTITYTYDDAGNVVQRKDRLGRLHDFTYDEKNQMATQKRPDGSVVIYGYNPVGDLVRVEDKDGIIRYAYDVTNVLDTVTEPDGDQILLSPNKAYEYWRIKYPNKITYRISRFATSGKIQRIWAFNDAGTDVTSDDGEPFRDLSYSYDKDDGTSQKDQGLVQTITDKQGKVTSFTYDALGRLTEEKTVDGATMERQFFYDYDKNSNRTLETAKRPESNGSLATTTTQFHHNDANQLTCSYNNGTRSDCTSASAVTSHEYDGNGNLLRVTKPNENPKSFAYDAANHTSKVTKPSGESVEMTYQDATQEERDSSNVKDALGVSQKETDYDYDLTGLTRKTEATTLSTATTNYIRTPDGQLLGQSNAGKEEYYILDHLGSVRDITDSAGNVVQKYTYEPYGRIFWQSNEEHTNDWRFAQGFFDTDISSYKLGERYYGSDTARFTQFDPVSGKIADPVTLNRYQYAGCDPANNVDPTGRDHFAEGTYETLEFVAGCLPGAEYGLLVGSFTPFPVAGPIVGAAAGCLSGGFTAQFLGVGLFDTL